ncbi:MAG: sel1 repeat family protein [Nitrospira sp.]|nr:MAG: sel1 repeat family protein [Nitrospira sp.]
MPALSVIILLVALVLPPIAFAEIQTFTAAHTYILGDRDSKADARQRCLLETKRKILEQAGVYIESASEVKNFDLTKDKITSFAAAVMQVKDTKEETEFQQGHMTLTLTATAQVDLAEVRKQLAARQLNADVRDSVAAQQERLKRLEAQLEAMQRQQGGQPSGHAPTSPQINISVEDLHTFHTQAVQGNAVAQKNLGILYHIGQGVQQDNVQARHWFEKAAAQGNLDAQFNLGMLYANGLGAPQDYAAARQWYEKAATQGNTSAQVRIGELYYMGQGVTKDYAQARQWFEKAAAQGNARAQLWLGMLHAMGWGVPEDVAQAAKWYQKAAVQGDVNAQSFLGRLYYKGQGVPQDYVQAHHWFEKAAVQGDADAQSDLGMLYAYGEGVPQDYAIARQWLEKSAAQGNGHGQLFVAWLYAGGNGDQVDDIQAYMWFTFAAERLTGNEQKLAQEGRDKAEARMTPAQFREAKQLAGRCQAQHFKGC